MDGERAIEPKFLKSRLNRRTENAGLAVLQQDPRMLVLPIELKRSLLTALGVPDAKPQAFDAVRLPVANTLVTVGDLERELKAIQLVEMKTTRRAVRDEKLAGFFFGVTESEYNLARSLGERYLFAFVVLNSNNRFGSEFFVLLTYDQLQQRVHSQRTQYQVTLKRGVSAGGPMFGLWPEPQAGDLNPGHSQM
jgi:hypothetical protein